MTNDEKLEELSMNARTKASDAEINLAPCFPSFDSQNTKNKHPSETARNDFDGDFTDG